MKASLAFAWVGGFTFIAVGVYLTYRRRRLHPLLLLCIAAISISWIEAPYDWAMYAQFAPAIPRMPSWWPLNMTWHGLPASVPIGYVSYFVTPALVAAALGRRLSARLHWRRPLTLLAVGLVVGFVWACLFNGILGARTGVFYYGRVIPGLALFQGTKHQYPLYDALAMGVMVMVFAYLLGRTDGEGRTAVETWASTRTTNPAVATVLSLVGVIVIANLLYGAVFAPHLTAKLEGWEAAGPTGRLFRGVPNQPLNGSAFGDTQSEGNLFGLGHTCHCRLFQRNSVGASQPFASRCSSISLATLSCLYHDVFGQEDDLDGWSINGSTSREGLRC